MSPEKLPYPLLINGKHESLRLATWNTVGNGLALVFNGNVYYKESVLSKEVQITYDGAFNIFNGVPDWVYEGIIFI